MIDENTPEFSGNSTSRPTWSKSSWQKAANSEVFPVFLRISDVDSRILINKYLGSSETHKCFDDVNLSNLSDFPPVIELTLGTVEPGSHLPFTIYVIIRWRLLCNFPVVICLTVFDVIDKMLKVCITHVRDSMQIGCVCNNIWQT